MLVGIGFLMKSVAIDASGRFNTEIATSALPVSTLAMQLAACTGLRLGARAGISTTRMREGQPTIIRQVGIVRSKDGVHLKMVLPYPIPHKDVAYFVKEFADALIRCGIFWHVEDEVTDIEVGAFPRGNPTLFLQGHRSVGH